jgi:hypothetical protein
MLLSSKLALVTLFNKGELPIEFLDCDFETLLLPPLDFALLALLLGALASWEYMS